MYEQVLAFLQSYGIPREGIIFIISMLPILELRLGLIAASFLHVPIWQAFIICIIGNILPLPFILLFIRAIFNFCKKHNILVRLIDCLESLAMKKSDSVRQKLYWGLFLFVAIPLPGTGGWTGSLIASMLNMPVKKSLPVICLGVACAGVIMLVISYFIPGFLISNFS